MPNDLIRYDLLVQEALCGVVKKVLGDAARHGLPGDHHFYITFKTHAPGVRLSSRMRSLYPEEMTIILQHQFEDLKVTDHAFEVGLSFKGVPEMLLVPFDALTGFFDPSVQFSAKFEPQVDVDEDAGEPEASRPDVAPHVLPRALPAPIEKPRSLAARKTEDLAKVSAAKDSGAKTAVAKDSGAKDSLAKDAGGKDLESEEPATKLSFEPVAEEGAPAESAKVVSIDAFRKKP